MNILNDQLKRGAFLTTEYDGKVNSMTIGWGMEGVAWGKPVFIALVRPSRYTIDLLDRALTFTVSIPAEGEMRKEISYLGTVSGRDEDKIKNAGIAISDTKAIQGKTIDGCEYYYECKVLYRQKLDKDCFIDPEIIGKAYADDDYHYVFYGEIMDSYAAFETE